MAEQYEAGPNWFVDSMGIIRPPEYEVPDPPDYIQYPIEIVEQVRKEYSGQLQEWGEMLTHGAVAGAMLREEGFFPELPGLTPADADADQSYGEGGLRSGESIEDWLTRESLRIVRVFRANFGGFLNQNIDQQDGSAIDAIRQISSRMWIFPQYNPLIKQMVDIRGLYVLGQGFEVKAESKRMKKRKVKEMREKHAALMQAKVEQQMMASQMMGQPPSVSGRPPGQGAGGGVGGAGNIGSSAGMMRNGANQASSTPGRAPSIPGGRREHADEMADIMYDTLTEELQEWSSPASGTAQGAMSSTGSRYNAIRGNDEESDIAKTVREFFEDPCTRRQFSGIRALQGIDKQSMIEGNCYVVMRNRGKGKMPVITYWRTWAVQRIIVDDLMDGDGSPLGYLVAPPQRYSDIAGGESDYANQIVIPDMVSNDIERLKRAMASRSMNATVDEGARLYHVKEWGPNWRHFGVPGILASLLSAVRYASYTADWVIMQRVQRAYLMVITGYGNNQSLQHIKGQYANAIAGRFSQPNSGGRISERTTPLALPMITGMGATGQPGTRVDMIRTPGNQDPPAMGREIRLLAEMGVGYPDNMFSDTNVGTMSRADMLERNTHLKFLTAQQEYTDMFKCVARTVIQFQLGDKKVSDMDVQVRFPKIVTPSMAEQAGTLIQLYQADGIPKRQFVQESLKLLGRPDVDETMEMLFPGDGDGMELKTDADLDTMESLQTGQGAPDVEATDANPLAMLGEEMGWHDFIQ